MKISLIIPVFNEEKYIANCLNCIMNQKVMPDEIIVINNNCTDNTVSIVKKYPLVRIVNETKQGMIAARNAGFEAAQYDIIARCDSDTRPPALWIKRIKNDFAKHTIDALTGPISYYDAKLKTTLLARGYLDLMRPIHRGKETLIGPNMVITKAMWEKVKNRVCLNDKLVHEDIDLAYHIHEAGGKIKRDDKLIMFTSSRRIKNNPHSFFGEYPVRIMKMLLYHDANVLLLKKQITLPVWHIGRRSRKKT